MSKEDFPGTPVEEKITKEVEKPAIKKPGVVQPLMRRPIAIGDSEQDLALLTYFPKNKIIRSRNPKPIKYTSSTGQEFLIAPYKDKDRWYISAPRELAEQLLGEVVPSWHLIFPEEMYFSKKVSFGEYKDVLVQSKASYIDNNKPIYK